MRLKKRMSFAAIFIGLMLVAGFLSSAILAKEKYEERFEKTVALQKDGKVSLDNISGSINVNVWDKEQVKIDALKVAQASTLSGAQQQAKEVEIEVKNENSSLSIKTKYPEGGKNKSYDVSVSYNVWIPDRASMRVNSISGNVVLEGIGGEATVKAISGNVTAKKVSGGVECEAVSGNLTVQDISGDAYLKTISGDISATSMKGSVQAESTSGSVDLKEITEAKNVSATVLSNSVSYQGALDPAGRYTMESFSGNVEMSLPPQSSFRVEAETFSGEIKSDFEIKVSGTIQKKEISGVVNDGGPLLKLSSFSGNILLKKM